MRMTQNVERFAFARFADANLRTHCVNATEVSFVQVSWKCFALLSGTQKTVSHDIMTMSKKRPRKRL